MFENGEFSSVQINIGSKYMVYDSYYGRSQIYFMPTYRYITY